MSADRIRELEAKVAALTERLEALEIYTGYRPRAPEPPSTRQVYDPTGAPGFAPTAEQMGIVDVSDPVNDKKLLEPVFNWRR